MNGNALFHVCLEGKNLLGARLTQEIKSQKTDCKRGVERNDHHSIDDSGSCNIVHFLPP